MILITKKRDEANLKNRNVSNLNDNTDEQLLDKVEVLENQNEELLDRVEKLEGIRGALEEKVSAYRYNLKELTKKLDDVDIPIKKEVVVYHNKDNLERRRFILQGRNLHEQAAVCHDSSDEVAEITNLQEKYERLLEQYMYEHDRNDQLFSYLFQEEENAALDLFVKVDVADTLLEATTLSRRIIQQAEDQAQHIGSDLKEQLRGVLRRENHLPHEVVKDLKNGIRCLDE